MNNTDDTIRAAAFAHLSRLVSLHGHVSCDQIAAGFPRQGGVVRLAIRPRGIFSPVQMRSVQSIKTVLPRAGRKLWYHDQSQVHAQIF